MTAAFMTARYVWVQTGIPPKCKLPKWRKDALKAKADEFIEAFYKPTILKPPPKEPRFNYVVDFNAKWHGAYLKFIACFACPQPNAVLPFFEHAFARLGYFRDDAWSLWARRHNEEWIVLGHQMTLEDCFERMRSDPWFHVS